MEPGGVKDKEIHKGREEQYEKFNTNKTPLSFTFCFPPPYDIITLTHISDDIGIFSAFCSNNVIISFCNSYNIHTAFCLSNVSSSF